MSIKTSKVTASAGLVVGDTAVILATVLDDGAQVDPTTLTVTVTDPLGAPTVLVWPPDGVLVKSEIGLFRAEVSVNVAGRWRVTSAPTVGWAAVATEFDVEPVHETVNVTVQSDDIVPVPIAEASVTFVDGYGVVRASALSNGAGSAVIKVRPGVYTISAQMNGVAFPEGVAFTVANTNGTVTQPVTVEGTLLGVDLTSPDVPEVFVFGYVEPEFAGQWGTRVVVETVSYGAQRSFMMPAPMGGTGVSEQRVMATASKREVFVNTKGSWGISVLSGSLVKVSIPQMRFMKIFRVPVGVSVLNIRDARPDPGPGGGVGIWSDTDSLSHLTRGLG